jgi:asparagine synthetase B (glutamine-hydrolysing)
MHPSFIHAHDSRSDPQGPDVQQQTDAQIRRKDNKEDIPLHFFASELQLRGTEVAKQPHHHDDGQNIFCWNGEVRGSLCLRVRSQCR